MEDNRRRSIMSSENDRISNLPELLIDLIFERLPLQDVVKTSILSKKWRYKWTRMKALVADEKFPEKFPEKFAKCGAFGRHGLIRIINLVLLHHKGPISKFHLCIPYHLFLDSFQEIDRWMLLLSRKGVRDLAVVNLDSRDQLLSYLFSCQQLRKLKLVNCFFYPPSKLPEFPYLEELFLKNIDFGAKLNEFVINLPQLKSLVLHRCTNVDKFNIKATKLQKVMVDAGPESLTYFHHKTISVFYTFICKPVENLVGVERMSLTRLFSNINNIQGFIFEGLLSKYFVAERTPKWLPHEVNSFWQLVLLEFELWDLSQLECALCLLQNAPNLKALKMTHVQMAPQDINYGLGRATNRLEPSYCLDQTFNQLQTVEIKSLRGFRPELIFIKLLLAHSPSLEKLTIQPSQTLDAIKRLDIAVDIMRFPRASTKAEVVFLNSDP